MENLAFRFDHEGMEKRRFGWLRWLLGKDDGPSKTPSRHPADVPSASDLLTRHQLATLGWLALNVQPLALSHGSKYFDISLCP